MKTDLQGKSKTKLCIKKLKISSKAWNDPNELSMKFKLTKK